MFNDDSHAPYFAYGSNLCIEQMLERVGPSCLDVHPEVAQLPHYRLAFNMRGICGKVFANIVTPGDGVIGVVYYLDPIALARLDEFEAGYDRTPVQLITRNGVARSAFAYTARHERICNDGRPSSDYLQRIITAARQWRLEELGWRPE